MIELFLAHIDRPGGVLAEAAGVGPGDGQQDDDDCQPGPHLSLPSTDDGSQHLSFCVKISTQKQETSHT